MHDLPPLIKYPVARLTAAMGFGIILFDWLLDGMDSSMSSWTVPKWRIDRMLLLCLFIFLVVSCFLLLFYYLSTRNCRVGKEQSKSVVKSLGTELLFHIPKHFNIPFITFHRNHLQPYFQLGFGLLTFIVFTLLGGIRLMQERQKIDYEWKDERMAYWGQVQTSPVKKGKMWRAEVDVEAASYHDSAMYDMHSSIFHSAPNMLTIHRRILLYWMPDSLQCSVSCGDTMLFAGDISRPLTDAEVTGFDYGHYLYRQGISGIAMAFKGDWRVLKNNGSISLKQYALKCREWIVDKYRSWKLGEEEFAVVSALTIGEKQGLTDSLKEEYSAAGVSHVLALSGLHIGIITTILYFILIPLRRFKRGKKMCTLIVLSVLWSFAFVTGLSPSVVRAVMMCTLYFIASCVIEGRFPNNYVLVFAAFLMLLYQPLYLFDLGFQLSFLAVASILYFYPIISSYIHVRNILLVWVWNSISISVSAQLGTLPLILYHFGTFPSYFILSNLIVGVLAVCVLCGTIGALIVGSIPLVGPFIISILDCVTRAMNGSIQWVQQLSGSQLESMDISRFQSICGFIFLISLYHFIRRRSPAYLIAMLVAVNFSLTDWNSENLRTDFSSLHFYKSHVFLKQKKQVTELVSNNNFYVVDSLRIAVLNDDQWRWKEVHPLIHVDYLYLCRGFKGNLTSLLRVFHFNRLIIDSSLSNYYRDMLIKECNEQHIPFDRTTDSHAYRVQL